MAEISFNISAAPSITNDLIAVIYKTTAPGAEVARIVDSTDHSSPQNFQFSDLDPGVYIVKIHESTDGTTLGNLRHDFWVDAVTNQGVTVEKRFYTVGGAGAHDPATDQSNLVDPTLDGITIIGVFKEGFRYLEPETEWALISGGGVQLLTSVFSTDEKFVVEIASGSSLGSTVSNDAFSEFVTFTGDVTLTSGEYNKTVLIQSVANKQTTALPLISGVPDQKGYVVMHDGGNAVNVLVKAQTGEVIRFQGADVNEVILGKGESVKLIKSGSKWYCKEPVGQWNRVGEVIPARQAGDNMLLCDGTTEYDLTVYLRLAKLVNSLPAAQVVDYATFAAANKQGFFAKDTVNNKVKLPMMFDMSFRFLKNNGGADTDRTDNIPGGYQAGMVGDFTATVTGIGAAVAGGNGGVSNIVVLEETIAPPFDGDPTDAENIEIVTGKETVTKNYGFLPYMLI